METLNEPKQANTPLPENPPAEETKSEVEAEDKTTTSEASE
jgi:hypothetical protein